MNPVRLVAFLMVFGVAVIGWALTCGAWQLDRVVQGVAPLEPARFARLTLVALGTGSAYENPTRRGPVLGIGLSERIVLVDAGRGVAEALRLGRIPVSQPEAVLLTSLLPENTVGLDDLLVTGWLEGRTQALRVLGPPGTAELTASLAASHRTGIEARVSALGLPREGARFAAEEIGPAWSATWGDLAVRAGELPGGPTPALAYRFEAGGRSAVVAGSGWANDALVEFAKGASLLSHEAVMPVTASLAEELGLEASEAQRLQRESALHTSIEAVGDLARRAGVETLVLVRLRPPPVYDLQLTGVIGRDFSGRVVIPDDGEWITP